MGVNCSLRRKSIRRQYFNKYLKALGKLDMKEHFKKREQAAKALRVGMFK